MCRNQPGPHTPRETYWQCSGCSANARASALASTLRSCDSMRASIAARQGQHMSDVCVPVWGRIIINSYKDIGGRVIRRPPTDKLSKP